MPNPGESGYSGPKGIDATPKGRLKSIIGGAAKVYKQLGSDFIDQARGKKLNPSSAEYE